MLVSPVKKKKTRKSSGLDQITQGVNSMKIDEDSTHDTYSQDQDDEEEEFNLPKEHPFFYLDRENQELIIHYGPDIYECSREMENTMDIREKFLSAHKIDSNVRCKMVDWMIEVLFAYNSDPPTFFLSVHLMDKFISKSLGTVNNNDVHLIGITCLYISSKLEDIIPLRMSHIKSKIGHNKFTEKEIKKCEKLILETLDFDIIATSTYDFIKTFIYDFCHNNKRFIKRLKMQNHIDNFDSVCVFLAKMLCHSEEFSHFNYSLKAIACIIAAFDILRSNSKKLSKEAETFMRQWVNFIFLNFLNFFRVF
jgi:hypothetical protein